MRFIFSTTGFLISSRGFFRLIWLLLSCLSRGVRLSCASWSDHLFVGANVSPGTCVLNPLLGCGIHPSHNTGVEKRRDKGVKRACEGGHGQLGYKPRRGTHLFAADLQYAISRPWPGIQSERWPGFTSARTDLYCQNARDVHTFHKLVACHRK
jgi:hypothetical protein